MKGTGSRLLDAHDKSQMAPPLAVNVDSKMPEPCAGAEARDCEMCTPRQSVCTREDTTRLCIWDSRTSDCLAEAGTIQSHTVDATSVENCNLTLWHVVTSETIQEAGLSTDASRTFVRRSQDLELPEVHVEVLGREHTAEAPHQQSRYLPPCALTYPDSSKRISGP